MAPRRSVASLLFLTGLCFVPPATGSSYQTYYLDDYCYDDLSRTIYLASSGPQSSAIIKISRGAGYRNDLKCKLVVKPSYIGNQQETDAWFGVLLNVQTLNLRKKERDICQDVLQVSYQKYDQWTSGIYGCWSNLTGKYVTSFPLEDDPELKVFFRSSPYEASASADYQLELIITAYNIKSTSVCSSVPESGSYSERFGCASQEICIWKGLTCDQKNNCGDRSDEWTESGAKCGKVGNSVVIGVSVSMAGLLIISLLCILCCWKRRRKQQANIRRSSSAPSAPLLSAVENQQDTSIPGKSSMSTPRYGAAEDNTQPPAYEEELPYPPPPPYRE